MHEVQLRQYISFDGAHNVNEQSLIAKDLSHAIAKSLIADVRVEALEPHLRVYTLRAYSESDVRELRAALTHSKNVEQRLAHELRVVKMELENCLRA
jgi:hypothetical protein